MINYEASMIIIVTYINDYSEFHLPTSKIK